MCPLYGTDAQFDPHMYFIVAGIVPFDKIPSPFQIIIVCFIQKTEYNVRAGRATGTGIEPATSRQRPCCPTTVPKNTGCCIDGDFEFWAIKCLNFVLKAGILQPVTSPSIFWTILFVCTRSQIKYTFCTSRVLLLPLPGSTGYSEACKHFEFGVPPQIARFWYLRALWTDWITGFTHPNWT